MNKEVDKRRKTGLEINLDGPQDPGALVGTCLGRYLLKEFAQGTKKK